LFDRTSKLISSSSQTRIHQHTGSHRLLKVKYMLALFPCVLLSLSLPNRSSYPCTSFPSTSCADQPSHVHHVVSPFTINALEPGYHPYRSSQDCAWIAIGSLLCSVVNGQQSGWMFIVVACYTAATKGPVFYHHVISFPLTKTRNRFPSRLTIGLSNRKHPSDQLHHLRGIS